MCAHSVAESGSSEQPARRAAIGGAAARGHAGQHPHHLRHSLAADGRDAGPRGRGSQLVPDQACHSERRRRGRRCRRDQQHIHLPGRSEGCSGAGRIHERGGERNGHREQRRRLPDRRDLLQRNRHEDGSTAVDAGCRLQRQCDRRGAQSAADQRNRLCDAANLAARLLHACSCQLGPERERRRVPDERCAESGSWRMQRHVQRQHELQRPRPQRWLWRRRRHQQRLRQDSKIEHAEGDGPLCVPSAEHSGEHLLFLPAGAGEEGVAATVKQSSHR